MKTYQRHTNYFKTMLLGGFVVVLPLLIFVSIVKWIIIQLHELISPVTNFLREFIPFQEAFVFIIAFFAIIFIFFWLGIFVETRLGHTIIKISNYLFEKFPGYKIIKEITEQIFNKDKSKAFSGVCFISPFSDYSQMFGFITDEINNEKTNKKSYVVFVPLSPPTSGLIFIVEEDKLNRLNISVDKAMKYVLSFGSGLSKIGDINEFVRKNTEEK